ncbi:MAG: cupredoxin family protein [Pseudomonadota bacterium]
MKTDHLLIALALALCAHAAVASEGAAHHHTADTSAKGEQMPWGIAGEAKAAKRTVAIDMSDEMRFTPPSVEVKQGETVRFVITNKGALMHEMVIGDRKTLDEHAASMMKSPHMQHRQPYAAHVAPRKSETLVWTFNRPGDFDFACLVAGHYQAGMSGKIKVSAHSGATGSQRLSVCSYVRARA